MQAQTLSGGFDTPALQSAHAFRSIMEAMARPGRIQAVAGAKPPAPLSDAAGTVLLTLCDTDTPVCLAGAADNDEVRAWLAFHTGAPLSDPSRCMFAVGTWDSLMPLDAFPVGTSEYPDRSATLIVETAELAAPGTMSVTMSGTKSGAMPGAMLTGPGIKSSAALSLPEIAAFERNRALFPLGLDFIFTCGAQLAALPRSTRVSAPEGAAEVL